MQNQNNRTPIDWRKVFVWIFDYLMPIMVTLLIAVIYYDELKIREWISNTNILHGFVEEPFRGILTEVMVWFPFMGIILFVGCLIDYIVKRILLRKKS